MKLRNLLILGIATAFMLTACIASPTPVHEPANTRVRLNQVVHSIFYAPQYAAIELGIFAEYGLDIELETGNGADRSMSALISNHADIALLGIEAALYVYLEGREDLAVPFAQLTAGAGNFLVSREPMPNFRWEDVRGRTIIGGRAGGMPQMVLEYILRQHGIEPQQDVEILTTLQFATTAAAFTGGLGDFTAEFDPSAFALEQAGIGYVVASMATYSGELPYTVYVANRSFIEANPEIIQAFTSAISRAQAWVAATPSHEVARVISPHFPENSLEDLAFMVERYRSVNVWLQSPQISRDGFETLQDIMQQGAELAMRVDFDNLVDNTFAN